MKAKDLFNIILKVFGLLTLKDLFFQLPALATPLMYLNDPASANAGLGVLIFSLLVLGLYFALSYMLLYKTDAVLRLLRFDDDFFATDLNLNISKKNVISIALVIVCGFILIDEVPTLCRHLFDYYELKQLRYVDIKMPTPFIIVSLVKIIIALLLIGERRKLVDFIVNEKADEEEEENQTSE